MNSVAPAPSNRKKECVLRLHGGDQNELPGKQECLKALKELNLEIARYCCLAMSLGGPQDSDLLREELTRVRGRVFDLANHNKSLFLPRVKGGVMSDPADVEDMERMWNCFICCLDVMEDKLRRTLDLQLNFPVHLGHAVFISTGVVDAGVPHKAAALSMEHLDGTDVDKRATERTELHNLEKDIATLHDMVAEMLQLVDLKPWTIEPEVDTSKFECNKSLHSVSDAGSVHEEAATTNRPDRHRKRKCVCIATVVLISVAVFTAVLALCITLLT